MSCSSSHQHDLQQRFLQHDVHPRGHCDWQFYLPLRSATPSKKYPIRMSTQDCSTTTAVSLYIQDYHLGCQARRNECHGRGTRVPLVSGKRTTRTLDAPLTHFSRILHAFLMDPGGWASYQTVFWLGQSTHTSRPVRLYSATLKAIIDIGVVFPTA